MPSMTGEKERKKKKEIINHRGENDFYLAAKWKSGSQSTESLRTKPETTGSPITL